MDGLLASSSVLMGVAVFVLTLSLGDVWDRLSSHYVADLTPMLDALSMDRASLSGYLRWWGAALILSFVIVMFVLGMPPLAPAAVVFVYLAPRFYLQAQIARRRTILRDQMVSATTALANACRAGLSLAQGLETVSREIPNPLASEFRKIIGEYQHGRPLSQAIEDTSRRLNHDSFTLFSSALLVSLERGGRVTEALDRISRSLQENQRVERKLEADTASGKRVVWLLAVFPFIFLAGYYVLDPQATMLFLQSLLGQIVLLAVIVLVALSVWWSQKILAIEL